MKYKYLFPILVALSLVTGRALAAYPEKPITVIIPFPAGSSVDALTRLVTERAAKILGQPIVLDFRAGAGGMIGANAISTATPDGYTLGFLTSTHAGLPALHKRLPYDPMKGFTHIALMTRTPLVMLAEPARTGGVLEAIKEMKAEPGRQSYGSAGNATPSHLAFELFKQKTGTFIVHIPYRGGPAYQQDLMAGRLQFGFEPASTAVGLVKAGRLRAVAVTGESRMSQLPDVPTLREQGVDLVYTAWGGFVAPPGTPGPIVERLNAAFREASRAPELKQRFDSVGVELTSSQPEAFRDFFASEITRLTQVIRHSGIQAD